MTPENNTPANNVPTINQPGSKPKEVSLRGIMIALIIFSIFAVLGTGFGIYGTIQANNALSQIESIDNAQVYDGTTTTYTYGKPSSVDEIEYVAISYNDNLDYIDIINDDNGTIEYYTFNDDEDYIGDTVEADVDEILQYIIDNDLEYLGENDYLDEETWGIEISSTNGYSYISGNGAAPDWFNDLLKKLDVDTNGYQSRNL